MRVSVNTEEGCQYLSPVSPPPRLSAVLQDPPEVQSWPPDPLCSAQPPASLHSSLNRLPSRRPWMRRVASERFRGEALKTTSGGQVSSSTRPLGGKQSPTCRPLIRNIKALDGVVRVRLSPALIKGRGITRGIQPANNSAGGEALYPLTELTKRAKPSQIFAHQPRQSAESQIIPGISTSTGLSTENPPKYHQPVEEVFIVICVPQTLAGSFCCALFESGRC